MGALVHDALLFLVMLMVRTTAEGEVVLFLLVIHRIERRQQWHWKRRDQLVPHLLVIHRIECLPIYGIAAILVVLPISVFEVNLRTHRLKKPARRAPCALCLGQLRGLDEPTVVLEEHLKHPAATTSPAPVRL
jgi:hypothetical protein